MVTHEQFIQSVACIVAARLGPTERAKVETIKLVYGAGHGGIRGVTYYSRWKAGAETVPFVEVSAFGQEHWVQVAGTTIHELAHVLAGWNAGHGPIWKEACERLGLRKAKAAGHSYRLSSFAPDIREAIAALPRPSEGEPVAALSFGLGLVPMKECPAGIGTRGGKSRGDRKSVV